MAEPNWTNSAQRLASVMQRDDALRDLLGERFVPVLIDPFQRPDLVAQWRWASIALTGTSGPPLLVLLTHEGLPFLSYCSMWPEGRPPFPSLASLARTTADAYERDPAAFLAEARALQASPQRDVRPAYRSAQALWRSLAAETDETLGGFQESPKHPHPQMLWLLLELYEAGEAPDAGAFVRTTLQAMVRGGINDQLAEGFHRCSRDERWVVPHFEKPVPLNAQLAAVYAKAAVLFEEADFRVVADDLAAFCATALRRSVDALGSESQYYTWTSREVLDHLDPALVQAIGFYYHITPDPSRQVLYRALEPEAMDRYSHESPDSLRQRIEAGRVQLRWVRNQRPAPQPVRLPALSWRAQSIHWLLTAAEHGCEVSVGELEAGLERLTADRFHDGIGYPRASDESAAPTAWLEDQAAILSAMLSVYRATTSKRCLEQAQRLADVMVGTYANEQGWLDRPGRGGEIDRSWAVTDDVLSSAVATATDALNELGTLLGDARYARKAHRVATNHVPALYASGQWGGAMWRAWFRCDERSG